MTAKRRYKTIYERLFYVKTSTSQQPPAVDDVFCGLSSFDSKEKLNEDAAPKKKKERARARFFRRFQQYITQTLNRWFNACSPESHEERPSNLQQTQEPLNVNPMMTATVARIRKEKSSLTLFGTEAISKPVETADVKASDTATACSIQTRDLFFPGSGWGFYIDMNGHASGEATKLKPFGTTMHCH